MIDLLSLFLGLTVGVQPVEVLTAPEVAAVELFLDGERVAPTGSGRRIEEGGVEMEVDFGAELSPHRLEVVALDAEGREIDRLLHDVNLAPGPAEPPTSMGEPGRTRVALTAEAARCLVGAGGGKARLRMGDAEARVMAVDGEGGDLVAVVDPRAVPCLHRLEESVQARIRYYAERTPTFPVAAAEGEVEPLPVGDPRFRLYFLDPRRLRPARDDDTLRPAPYLLSPGREVRPAELALELSRYRPARPGDGGPVSAEAVATAARHAWAGGRRRAVVLVVGPGSGGGTDAAGRYSEVEVVRYLERLGVPLHVWRCGGAGSHGWGDARQVRHPASLIAAADRLLGSLRRQRVVWVEGRHLPGEVARAGAQCAREDGDGERGGRP